MEITEISDMPDYVIDNILDRLPLGDAVRTSILSRKWSHHWTRLRNLVFDEIFIKEEIVRGYEVVDEYEYEYEDNETLRSTYSDAIGTVLFLHCGPINKFHLEVPEFFEGSTADAQVNKWMHYVSRNGVKDIKLKFRRAPLPSYVFHCQELRCLSLQGCGADLPSYFTGFSNLINLHLSVFSANGDGGGLNVLISGCPLLENLSLEHCKGPLNVNAPRLKTFKTKYCSLDGLTMQNVPNLVTASFGGVSILSVQPHRIETFFDPMLNIESITLDKGHFKVLDEHHIPKTFPTPLKCLKHLTLCHFGAMDRVRMLFCLCIFRSSPYLQTLNVGFDMPNFPRREVLAPTAAFYEEQFSEPCYLKNVITVKMKPLKGTWAQIAFIKFILASCPALEEFYVTADMGMSQTTELKITTELNECSRASAKAKIIYSKYLDTYPYNVLSYSKGEIDRHIFDF